MADIFDIENCPLDYSCAKTWDELIDTNDPNIKFCKECLKNVRYCETIEEFDEMSKIGHCVAYRVYKHGENDGVIWEATLGLPARKNIEMPKTDLEKFIPKIEIETNDVSEINLEAVKKNITKK